MPQSEFSRKHKPRQTDPVFIIHRWHLVLLRCVPPISVAPGPSAPASLPGRQPEGGKWRPEGKQRDVAAPVRTSGSNQQPLWLGRASKDYRAGGGGLLCAEQGRGPKWCRWRHERTMLEGISVVWNWGACGREERRQCWPEQRAGMCTQEGPLWGLWGAGCHVSAVGAMNRTSGVITTLTDLSSHSQASGSEGKRGACKHRHSWQ